MKIVINITIFKFLVSKIWTSGLMVLVFVGQDAIRCAWPGAVVRSGAHAGCQVPLADGARPDSGEQTIPGHQTLWYVLILTIKLFGICVNTGHQLFGLCWYWIKEKTFWGIILCRLLYRSCKGALPKLVNQLWSAYFNCIYYINVFH